MLIILQSRVNNLFNLEVGEKADMSLFQWRRAIEVASHSAGAPERAPGASATNPAQNPGGSASIVIDVGVAGLEDATEPDAEEPEPRKGTPSEGANICPRCSRRGGPRGGPNDPPKGGRGREIKSQ